jgi:hypothetical protein
LELLNFADTTFARSMTNYINISAPSWTTKRIAPKIVASAMRHNRTTLGCEFGQGRLVSQSRYGLTPNRSPGKQELS